MTLNGHGRDELFRECVAGKRILLCVCGTEFIPELSPRKLELFFPNHLKHGHDFSLGTNFRAFFSFSNVFSKILPIARLEDTERRTGETCVSLYGSKITFFFPGDFEIENSQRTVKFSVGKAIERKC